MSNNANNLSDEFVSFIRSCFGSENGSWEDSYVAYDLIRKDKPYKDRLQYLKTEFLSDSPPNESRGIDYRIIFKDLEDPLGAHYAFECDMSSWYSWEDGNILCELRRWTRVNAQQKVVTVYE